MNKVLVDLGDRSYPIFIGSNLMDSVELKEFLLNDQVLIVTNETVAPLYLDKVKQMLSFESDSLILPDGEQFKTLEVLNLIFDHLLEHRHNRTTTLIALGGGVIGDMTGFAAACYQRGVRFIQMPTTLLAQVDSSVGGKTAVNHLKGKNMIGAFYQPEVVIADTGTLSTLPDREFRSGLAEVVKYGLIGDAPFFEWLEKNIHGLLVRDEAALEYAIERSCINKAAIVNKDERESGIRAILNFGHTFGHAIETFQSYTGLLHGEAVSVGMAMAADFSCRSGYIALSDVARIKSLLMACHLPVVPPVGMSLEAFMSLMSVDKKVVNGAMKFVLLAEIGSAFVSADFSAQLLQEVLENSIPS